MKDIHHFEDRLLCNILGVWYDNSTSVFWKWYSSPTMALIYENTRQFHIIDFLVI